MRCHGHTLKVTLGRLLVAIKGDFGLLVAKEIDNHFVDHIAHLVVGANKLTTSGADTASLVGHKSIADRILGADVAVDATPSFVAFTVVARSHRSIASPRK